MELTQLRYFVLVAENGSTARAAAAAMVSQSTISKSLLHLERELGLPLFDREGNHLVLNPAGQEFLQQVRPILTAVGKLPDFIKTRHQPKRQYRLNISAAQPVMGEFVHSFLQQQANVQLLLTEGNWIDDCDLSIAASPSGRQEDSIQLLEERVLLAIPNRLLPKAVPLDLVTLEGLPLILPGEGSELRSLLDRQVFSMPAVMEVLAEVSDGETLRKMVEAGDGAAFWPEITWPRPNEETTSLCPLAGITLTRKIYAILPPQPRQQKNPLLDAVMAYFEDLDCQRTGEG